MKITDSNISETTEKLTSGRKSLVKQQILINKTSVYRLFNGGITHQKQQISDFILAWHVSGIIVASAAAAHTGT